MPKSYDKDDQFDELINSFETKLKSSTKNISNDEDKDDW